MKKNLWRHYIGKRVRSTYAARWTGTVIGPDEAAPNCVRVQQEFDASGAPMRNPKVVRLNIHWLVILDEAEQREGT